MNSDNIFMRLIFDCNFVFSMLSADRATRIN